MPLKTKGLGRLQRRLIEEMSGGPIALAKLCDIIDESDREVRCSLDGLRRRGLVSGPVGALRLTAAGAEVAGAL